MVAKKRLNLQNEKKVLKQRAIIAKVIVPVLSAWLENSLKSELGASKGDKATRITKNQELLCNETDCHTETDFDLTINSHDLEELKLNTRPSTAKRRRFSEMSDQNLTNL